MEMYETVFQWMQTAEFGAAKTELLHPELVVLDASNIVPIWERQRFWDFNHDFPFPVPPWPRCFVEWEMPHPITAIRLDQGDRRAAANRLAVIAFCMDRQKEDGATAWNAIAIQGIAELPPEWEDARWILYLHILNYERTTRQCSVVPANFWSALDSEARLIPGAHFVIQPWGPESGMIEDLRISTVSFHVPFLAWSLCNCRNVTIETVIPARAAKRRLEKLSAPQCEYKVLAISPIGKVSVPPPNGVDEKEKRFLPLHIVRGHFKNYDKRPLFGRYRGQYWWSQQARGAMDLGQIDKDYTVSA